MSAAGSASETGMYTRPLTTSDISALCDMARIAESEGFRFVMRLVDDLGVGRVRLDAPCEFFLATLHGDQLIAVGGVTQDPYVADPRVGRLRHLYVRADRRRTGVGSTLVAELERRAASCYERLRLRTDNPAAAAFYERRGYHAVTSESATHHRTLPPTRMSTQPTPEWA